MMKKAALLFSLTCLWLTTSSAELVITRPPKNATVLLHTRFLLHCEASGYPKPRVKWFHNDNEMVKDGINYKVRGSGALRFQSITVNDRGIYRCQVQSGRETLFSDPVHLTVQAKAEIITYTPADGSIEIPYRGNVFLICKVAAIPPPVVQWRKDGESITNPDELGLEITDRIEGDGVILKSKLMAFNMTSSSQFECEAHNEHIGGITVKAKKFNVAVKQPEDGNKSRSLAQCVRYNGTRCSSVLGKGYVFFNSSYQSPFAEQEALAVELISQMDMREVPTAIQERCNGNMEKFICNLVFPPCEDYDPKPKPVCRETCKAVQDLLCYVQWPNVKQKRKNKDFHLPDCDESLPSKWDTIKVCTEANLFERSDDEVTSVCFKDSGRWYNGTVNVTVSGQPCQRWSSNTPKTHKRPPTIYAELENSENYCRNPGAEEKSPWCYIDTEDTNVRWELCDIPQCEDEPAVNSEASGSSLSMPTILTITIVSTVGVFVLVLITVLCFHVFSQRKQSFQYKNTPQEDLEIDIEKLPANMSYHRVDEPIKLNPKLEAFEYPRNDIVYIRDIGQGAFGRVFKAKAPNLTKGDETLIAVKMLKDDASDDLQVDFEREASLMAEFDHPNIVKFLGVCAIGKPMCLLFEYMDKGDLNEYLRMCSPEQYIVRKHHRDIYNHELSSIDIVDQLDLCRQIAAGMMYLSNKGYVHRDLATRNCLVRENRLVKISDFGLARSVHSIDYYKGSDNDAIPIRWMPLESILYNKFTVETDIWSFGVVLWEIFSYALQPYYGMTHEEVVEYIKEGKNLVCPTNTPQQVYELMLMTWNRKPSQRPSFQSLHKCVCALSSELTKKRLKEAEAV